MYLFLSGRVVRKIADVSRAPGLIERNSMGDYLSEIDILFDAVVS
jgi:hypothetical protein